MTSYPRLGLDPHWFRKKKGKRAKEQSSDELAMKVAIETMSPARTRMAISPSPWLAWPYNLVKNVERKMAKLLAS
jgi:hypothetical protein